MKSTLEQYIDLDNIPKKYGGNLNWEFGDLPFLDPGIVKSLKWEESNEQKGHKTIPIGPIKWKYDDNGDLAATAIGSEHGKPRNRVIARYVIAAAFGVTFRFPVGGTKRRHCTRLRST